MRAVVKSELGRAVGGDAALPPADAAITDAAITDAARPPADAAITDAATAGGGGASASGRLR